MEHPVWGPKPVRAIFNPQETLDIYDNLVSMIGHEFTWEFVSFWHEEEAVWRPQKASEIEDYYEVLGEAIPDNWENSWFLERDLYILGIDKRFLDS